MFQYKKDENDGFDKSLFRVKKDLSKPGTEHLIAFARYVVLLQTDIHRINVSKLTYSKEKKDGDEWDGHIDAFCLENEIAAWRYINKAADAALAKYPTLLEEDLEILDKDRH